MAGVSVTVSLSDITTVFNRGNKQMTHKEIALENSQVPAHLRGTYNGRKFSAVVTDSVTIPAQAGNWGGGSRDTYKLVNVETGAAMDASDNISAPWDSGRQDRVVNLRPGFAVILHSMFCGKDMGLTFYVHPENAAKLLPAPSAALSAHESIVLEATCSFKSSYMGKDRFEMMGENARYDAKLKATFPTREQWDAAKASLIGKGLLNKAGAVTVAGRNARGNVQ